MELQLRTAQCDSSLQGLCQALRVKTRLVYFKTRTYAVNVRECDRNRSLIASTNAQFNLCRSIALLDGRNSILKGRHLEHTYRELRNEDIRGFTNAKPKIQGIQQGIWEDGHAPPAPEEVNPLNDKSDSDPDLNNDAEDNLPPKKKRKKGTGET